MSISVNKEEAEKVIKLVIAINFILPFFLFIRFWANGWYGTFYLESLKTFNIQAFTLPLLWWIGIPAYRWLGEAGLFVLPLLFFYAGYYAILATLREYPLIPMFLFPLIFLRTEAANWLLFFSRDNLIFMFAGIFTYYFAKVWIKREDHYLKLFILALLALYTKTSGLTLFVLLAIIWMRNNHNVIFEKDLFPILGIPFYRESWIYTAWLADLQKIIASLLNMKYFNMAFLVPNPIFFLSIASFLILKRFTPFMIVLMTILTGISIHNISPTFYDLEVVWRYSFILLPINILLIAEGVKKINIIPWKKF